MMKGEGQIPTLFLPSYTKYQQSNQQQQQQQQ